MATGYLARSGLASWGSHDGIWTGRKYPEKERALRDAVQHNKEYPGHDATIEH